MNYEYIAIKEIDGEIKAVVNKSRLSDFISNNEIEEGNSFLDRWQSTCIEIPFSRKEELSKVMFEVGSLNKKIYPITAMLAQGQTIEVSCIEIKDGKAYFKPVEKETKIT